VFVAKKKLCVPTNEHNICDLWAPVDAHDMHASSGPITSSPCRLGKPREGGELTSQRTEPQIWGKRRTRILAIDRSAQELTIIVRRTQIRCMTMQSKLARRTHTTA
jgi:hypothetical protein